MRRRIGISFLIAAIAACTFVVWVGQTFEAHRRDHAEAPDTTPEPRPRPPLWGTALPGPAWPQYRQALSASPDPASKDELLALITELRAGGAASAATKAHLERAAPRFDQLERGAHSAVVGAIVDARRGQDFETAALLEVRELTQLVTLQAYSEARAGREEAAVRTLLNGLQLAGDLMRTRLLITEMVGASSMAMLLHQTLVGPPPHLIDASDDASQQLLARGLGLLDRSLALESRGIHGELEAHRKLLLNLDLGGTAFGSRWEYWRFGFSLRLALIDHAKEMRGWQNRYAGIFVHQARDLGPAIDRLFESAGKSLNPLTQRTLPPFADGARSRLETIALLRLARVALAIRAGNEEPSIQDALGGLFVITRTDGDVWHLRSRHRERIATTFEWPPPPR